MSEALLLDDPLVTIAAFNAFLAGQADDRLWELVEGRIVGMTNPTERHAQIVANIGLALGHVVQRRGCRVYFGGMRVQRSDEPLGTNKAKPDLLVRCGLVGSADFVSDPLIVVEVLSPSAMDVDRGDKLRFYKRLPTLTQIVLVYQDQIRAEQYLRIGTGWELEVVTHAADHLSFPAFDFGLPLADAYGGVEMGV